MNFRPDPATLTPSGRASHASSAGAVLITASYAPDLDRCRLLCETADRHVAGLAHHYILVEGRDVALFRQLESGRRTVVDERDLLPAWLRAFDDPTSLFKRRIWLSLRTQPLRGWHVQQLRRIAVASHLSQDTLVFCDSDVAFLKPIDLACFRRDGLTRLFRRDHALLANDLAGHRVWAGNAARSLGLASAQGDHHDYITTLIAWDRETTLAMRRRIEDVAGRHWVAALGGARRFSECLLYGRFVDEIAMGRRHFHDAGELCKVFWDGAPMTDDEFRAFVAGMTPDQVAIGMQSFIGTDIARIRRLVLESA